MRIRTFGCLLLLCLGCIPFIHGQKEHDRGFMTNAISLRLSADKLTVASGDPVIIKITVANSAKEPLYLPTTPCEWNIRREDGKPADDTPEGLKRKKNLHALQTMNVSVQLEAGKSITTEEKLSILYKMDSPGVYSVSVQQAFSDENGTGYIRSNTLHITIR